MVLTRWQRFRSRPAPAVSDISARSAAGWDYRSSSGSSPGRCCRRALEEERDTWLEVTPGLRGMVPALAACRAVPWHAVLPAQAGTRLAGPAPRCWQPFASFTSQQRGEEQQDGEWAALLHTWVPSRIPGVSAGQGTPAGFIALPSRHWRHHSQGSGHDFGCIC